MVVAAVIIALLMGGTEIPPAAETAPAMTEPAETVPVPTIPADGNPDDETCKGTYTVTDEEAVANAATVVATIGDHKLTNAQLQAFYWMPVQSFLSSEYGRYMMYYGVLDYTQPLDFFGGKSAIEIAREAYAMQDYQKKLAEGIANGIDRYFEQS